MTPVRSPSRDAAVGGDHRAAADRRHELLRPQLLAGFGHVRQADEDQILERFADGEQIDARHARKV